MSSSQSSPRTLVLGLGATGLATVAFLRQRGAPVRVADTRMEPPGLERLRADHPDVDVRLGDFDPTLLAGVEQVVVSPGLPADLPLLSAARVQQLAVVGDIELFAKAATAPVVAITGSNGKSTVTTLVARMLEAAGYRIGAGGNLGPPALSVLDPLLEGYVLELSSFQLEHTSSLVSRSATVLNISADHMDRHGSVTNYAAIKARIFAGAEHAVVNRDDPVVRRMALDHPRRVSFGLDDPSAGDFGVRRVAGVTWLVRGAELLLPAAKLRIAGRHNIANGLAALALADGFGAALPLAVAALENFPGLPHRCEWVGESGGVTFVNDSKGTNVGATVAALEGFAGPLILIAGGVGKDADFTPLTAAARGPVKAAVLFGQDARSIQAVLRPVCPVTLVSDMAEAVAVARRLAVPGDTVLLSPACASLDMYEDYAARGEDFRARIMAAAP